LTGYRPFVRIRHMSTRSETDTAFGAEWNGLIGPFSRKERVVRLLGISSEQVDEMAQRIELLALTTAGGVVVFPSFQLVEDSETHSWHVLNGLKEVLEPFNLNDRNTDPDRAWTVASWLKAERMGLAETPRSIVDYLKEGGDPSVPAFMARSASARWNS
jgi:hypothetical protein